MNPEQALQILYEAAAQALLPKQNHIMCEQAYQVLKSVVSPTPPAADAADAAAVV